MIRKSCKGSYCLAHLEKEIDELSCFKMSRNDKTNGGIAKSKSYSHADLMRMLKELKAYKSKITIKLNPAAAMMITIDENLEGEFKTFEKKLLEGNELKIIQTRLEIELLWFIFLCELKKESTDAGEIMENRATDLSAPDMVARLVKLLMLNRERDRETIETIKTILINWEE